MNDVDMSAVLARHRLHERWLGRRTSVGIVFAGDDQLPAATPERRVVHRRCGGTGVIDVFIDTTHTVQTCSCDRGWITVTAKERK